MAIASAHHRFNYIHPFPDGNGRVSRLMSHAMAGVTGIGAHGLWSISRGFPQRPFQRVRKARHPTWLGQYIMEFFWGIDGGTGKLERVFDMEKVML